MKRYSLRSIRVPYGYDIGMVEDDNGPYVRYADIALEKTGKLLGSACPDHGTDPMGCECREGEMSLPTEAAARKNIPIYSGCIKYFPLALAAVADLSRRGNEQHNPGKPLHWDRSKSGDELDALMRHLVDEAAGVPLDTDGVLHATKVAWRALANLQKLLERK